MADWGTPRSSGPRDWALVERFLLEDLEERRRARRWRWARRVLFIALFAFLAWKLGSSATVSPGAFGPHTAVIQVDGQIAADLPANADSLIDALGTAFKTAEAKAVVLRINSPGGSPVQADEVYREIRRLRAKHPDKPLYAVIGDMGASGAYYIAAAADRIYVNPSSLVGSIGVIMPGFGVPELLRKLGVEDRTLTAGEHKNLLSPTRAVDPVEREHVQGVLDAVHRQFIAAVKQGRGERLRVNQDTFSGYFWSGEQAIALGLADEVGSLQSVARDVVKQETLVDYTLLPSPVDAVLRRLSAETARGLGAGLRQALGLEQTATLR
ncbi:signal peptide peptidase SppA [Amnimonas aquatica]|uniref:Signal peptide peptidase SppA n=1 Tax=Amnimonas aquatica TaxID=2094561 RepID=A0A2P6AUP7_9GAMM|nr:signal peptide peptidase SppA [Amnimonas aquatica]PQA50890.1 signal peptide peptidase SppA [Amnimonas aquatica]